MPKIKFTPSNKQWLAWKYLTDDITTDIGYGGGANGGKSYLMCYWLTIMCLQHPKTRYGFGRKELKTLKRTTLLTLFKVFEECGIDDTWFKYNQQQDVITFKNGSQIFLVELTFQPRDPHFTRFGGMELTGAAIDESNECTEESVDILSSRVGRCMNSEYGLKPKVLQTFNPDKGFVYRKFYKPWRDKESPEHVKFVRALATDNPTVTQDYIDQLKKRDKVTVERLLYGNFEYSDDPSTLMEYDAICDLFTNSAIPYGEVCISADIARFGKDLTTIMVWKGFVVDHIHVIKKGDVIYTAQEIRKIADRYAVPMSSVIVDEDGVGGGVVDFLKCKGFVANKSPIKRGNLNHNYNNIKSQCYFMLAKMVNERRIWFKPDFGNIKDMLMEELEVVKKDNVNKEGKNAVLKKEIVKDLIGRSPDYSDCMMMRMFFEIGRNEMKVEFL
jgi:phage terminase large subunit